MYTHATDYTRTVACGDTSVRRIVNVDAKPANTALVTCPTCQDEVRKSFGVGITSAR